MKNVFHGRETLARLSLFATLGLAIFGMVFTYLTAQGHEIGSPNMQLREHIELDAKAPFVYKKYTGPQNAQELMKALDADYTKSLAKTRVSVSGKFTDTKTVIYSSDLTLSEIDARYPRAEWLQLLLDRGITIDDSLEYASLLSKRYTLALLEDNPDLQQSEFLGIPPTDDWDTYKVAYIDKLVNDHTKIQEVECAVAQIEQDKLDIERGKKAVERAVAQIEQSKEHAKLAIERSKESVKRANAQLKRGAEQLEHSKAQIAHSKEQVKRAQKALTSQQFEQAQKQLEHAKEQLERAKKQIEHVQETLKYLKEPTPPQKPTPPKEPTPP